jgi:hypothetical protein
MDAKIQINASRFVFRVISRQPRRSLGEGGFLAEIIAVHCRATGRRLPVNF